MGMMRAHMALATAKGDVDFMVHGLILLKVFGHNVWITTTHVTTLIVMVTIIVIACVFRRAVMQGNPDKPSGLQNAVEFIIEMLDKFVESTMGKHWRSYVNYIGSIAFFIFISNTSGLFGLRAPTADYGTTLALALITFCMIQYAAFKTSHFGMFKDLFKPIPILFPSNVIGELATPVSLSLRLFGNIMAGTIMISLWYGLLPVFAKLGVPAFLHVYFDLFSGAIQTFVFAMLTMTFITQKRDA
ncbi:MAG: F0F1 ATP synthase subunit A [Anaerostipes sp.]|nr:F0F1 ATP synthase subunit A [Anaerostipes sp.]